MGFFDMIFGGSKKASKRASSSKSSGGAKQSASKATSKKKAPSKKSTRKNGFQKFWNSIFHKSDERKIYKTTDGYFTQNPTNRKPRHIAVIKQRKDDGALAVCKIHSKEGKSDKRKVQGLTLSPKKHKSLKEDSVVSSNVIVATKNKEGKFKPIYKGDFQSTKDKLTKKEHQHIMNNLGGGIEKHKKTSEDLLQNWENHFQNK